MSGFTLPDAWHPRFAHQIGKPQSSTHSDFERRATVTAGYSADIRPQGITRGHIIQHESEERLGFFLTFSASINDFGLQQRYLAEFFSRQHHPLGILASLRKCG